MKKGLLLGIGAVAVVLLIGWAAFRKPASSTGEQPLAAAPSTDTELSSVPRIAVTEARQRIDSGAVVVIDVRDANSYVAAHIPGSLQIPLMRVEGEMNYLPRGKPILTYCT